MPPKSTFYHAMTCFFTTDQNSNPPKKKPAPKNKSKRNADILLSELIPSKPKRRPQINNAKPKISKEIVDLTMEEDDPMPIKIQILDETLNMDPILIHIKTDPFENANTYNTSQIFTSSDKSLVKTEKTSDNDSGSLSLKEENFADCIFIDCMSTKKQSDPLRNDVPMFEQSIDANTGLSSDVNKDIPTNNEELEKVCILEENSSDSMEENVVIDGNPISSECRKKNFKIPKRNKRERFHFSRMTYVEESKSYYCFLCEVSIKQKQVASHIQANKRPRSNYRCSFCEQRFQWKAFLTRHLRQHFSTSNLEKKLKSDHITEDVSITPKSTTDDANETFNNLEQLLQSNNTSIHSSLIKLISDTDRQDINFACGYCDQCFSSQVSLVEHCRTHMDDKAFICNICGTLFKQNAALVYHTRSHFRIIRKRGKKKLAPFVRYVLRLHSCNDCNRSYISWSALNQHILNNHSATAEQFVCKKCDRIYYTSGSLHNHKNYCNKVDSKKKWVVACEICKKRYISNDSLRNHVLKVHPNFYT